MIYAWLLDSPANADRKRSSAERERYLRRKMSPNILITCSASLLETRSRPLSTNTRSDFTDGAAQLRMAVTKNPRRRSTEITLSSPTRARECATASSMIFAGVHRASHWQIISRTKRLQHAYAPAGVITSAGTVRRRSVFLRWP